MNSIGTIISGSLTEGLVMRVDQHVQLSNLKTGKFVSISTNEYKFFSLIADLRLEVSHPDILLFPPTAEETLLKQTLAIKDIYATATLRPMVMLDTHQRVLPVKTVPPHFALVYDATKKDIDHIFGNEKDPSRRYFAVGTPLDMDASVCIDLEKITERSNGIFGKTGTGKTFLTRLVLAGLIHRSKAVCVIFDMHSEYGLQARTEGGTTFVKGLKTLFPSKVAIFSLDPASTRQRGASPDEVISLTYESISVEDVISLQEELNLHATASEAAYLLGARYHNKWLETLFAHGEKLKELAQEVGAHPESISALYRKLKQIQRFPFIHQSGSGPEATIDKMIEYIDRGISIIVEFGNFTSTFCYLLLANIITRRLHSLYIQKTERFLGSKRADTEPKKLLIVIEEAHKFLNVQAARQTIFGTIAREMRKYYVSLLVVDQRPSGIDPEILSQIGTKIIAQLNDERDIQAILTGTSHTTQLRSVLASLDSKKQVLLLGHALTMPIVIETRQYDETLYAALKAEDAERAVTADELF